MRLWICPCRMAGLAAVLLVLLSAAVRADERPNVVLFIGDDISWNDFGCYGNRAARTPNVDALARQGRRFDAAFLTASSCSPSRSSIITGRYPHNLGPAAELHREIAWRLPWFPRLLRESGYYTALSGKHHMKAADPPAGESAAAEAFDLVDGGRAAGNSGGHANWVSLVEAAPADKPFFMWFAAYDAHRGWDADSQWDAEKYGSPHDPEDVWVPPYLSDDPETRQDLASYYNEVTRYDYYIGKVVEALRRRGELDNTLILVMADNGRPFPRAKTRLHDSGMQTPLVAHWPAGLQAPGETSDSLVSAIDLAPTILSLAGVDVPATMQGVDITPILREPSAEVRSFAFSEHNWHDYEAHGRAVRDGEFLYIRNHWPQQPWQGPADSVRSPSHVQLQQLRDAQKLSVAQADVFLAPRPSEELYRTRTDPWQLNNLIDDPQFAADRQRLSRLLDLWMEQTGDVVPEQLTPDTFDRETGKPLPVERLMETADVLTRQGAATDSPGPR